ncbi:pleckstrin homology domain-containing family N member 1-like isoform X1 [Megalops cyprinoides]|uniref:pleckstrin homology domain-containing family N member 1-like isoform X1 n=1 Tax=Megalops cyprinoides TaxID=118141 RepID=UPI00186421D1|nr:pleckstrin homology domain-containing family N member 1-like isoform X1 [Megalops cyprinoides]
MGGSMSCYPQHSFGSSRHSFIRTRSGRLFRKKHPQEGPEKSNSIINIMSTVTPMKEMSAKDLETIQNIKWSPPQSAHDPSGGWKKSSVNVKNYGRLIHSSKLRFRFAHCQEVHDCYLDLFQTHLHFVSRNTTGLTYQGTLPLKELAIWNLQSNRSSNQLNPFAFQINGVSLNPIVVLCSSQVELDTWMHHLTEHVEANGGSVVTSDTLAYTRIKNTQDGTVGREELRNSVENEPIYEWEGSQRESLGPITYITKVRLQHLPCQEQFDRLLVMYPATLIILSEESNGLFYKGKLSLNMITVTTPCQDVRPNTFMIEGQFINPIVVSCLDKKEFHEWLHHFKASHVPVQIPPPPVYDIIDTPTKRTVPGQIDRWSGHSSQGLMESQRFSQNGRGSYELQFHHPMDNPLSPGYTEPLYYRHSQLTSAEPPSRHSYRSNSFSSRMRPGLDFRPPSQRYSYASTDAPMSPVYSTPYNMAPRMEKSPLVKSNSWSVPQSMRYQLSSPQRSSDMCALRRPLSPLYDDPSTPGRYLQEDNYVRPAQVALQYQRRLVEQRDVQLLPPSFRLRTPPMGRRRKNTADLEQEEENAQWTAEQRAQAVAKLKLLSPPTATLLPSNITQTVFPPQSQPMPYNYLPDENCFLEPAEPDDQEMDYDNVWDFDNDGKMIQPLPGFSAHRTMGDVGAPGIGYMSAQQRWS